jgi:hypothetical protein
MRKRGIGNDGKNRKDDRRGYKREEEGEEVIKKGAEDVRRRKVKRDGDEEGGR